MKSKYTTINGQLVPIKNRVLVTDMLFGDQRTRGGLIITDDDGTTRGIYPRWARVVLKGPENTEEYGTGDWILVEHGRWTRGINMELNDEVMEVRVVEAESILGFSDTRPDDVRYAREN
jgi:co-chaperonin GroES (HSP10)